MLNKILKRKQEARYISRCIWSQTNSLIWNNNWRHVTLSACMSCFLKLKLNWPKPAPPPQTWMYPGKCPFLTKPPYHLAWENMLDNFYQQPTSSIFCTQLRYCKSVRPADIDADSIYNMDRHNVHRIFKGNGNNIKENNWILTKHTSTEEMPCIYCMKPSNCLDNLVQI